ncbi:hypothetical protein CDAR_495081 [Caerostris darwini]|uniref:Uncharacterized protein n=1 Tax=Caerostris darwini TaxID=1538125 RepID=A0AAV4N8E5_9ARAC|nr:hypothetical protein CDAR_495081 [Caerostris darwini]
MYVGDAMVETADLSKGYMVAAVKWCRRLAQSKSLGIILDGRTNHQKYGKRYFFPNRHGGWQQVTITGEDDGGSRR